MKKKKEEGEEVKKEEVKSIDPLSYMQGEIKAQSEILDEDEEALRRKARRSLSKAAPQAVDNLIAVSNGQIGDGAKEIIQASEAILDRAGLPKGQIQGSSQGSLPLEAMAAALLGITKVLGVASSQPKDVTPRKISVEKD